MKKGFFFCFVCLILILAVSCGEDEISALGKNLQKLGNNVIGAKKDYTQENTALSSSVDSVITSLVTSEPSGEPAAIDPVESLIDSIKAFSNAPVVKSNPATGEDGYEYEKRVDLSAPVSFKDKTEEENTKKSLTEMWEGKKSLLAESKELDMNTYSVKAVMESAKEQLGSFMKSFSGYSKDSAVKKAVDLANLCMTNAEEAVMTAVSHLDGNLTYEDVVVITLANSVKNEFGKYAVDTSYRGRDIIAALGTATEYLDTLKIMGIIPKFNEASLLLELSEYFDTVN